MLSFYRNVGLWQLFFCGFLATMLTQHAKSADKSMNKGNDFFSFEVSKKHNVYRFRWYPISFIYLEKSKLKSIRECEFKHVLDEFQFHDLFFIWITWFIYFCGLTQIKKDFFCNICSFPLFLWFYRR